MWIRRATGSTRPRRSRSTITAVTQNPLAALTCGTILLLAVLGGLFALAWHGTISGAAVITVVTVIVSGALAILGGHVGATRAIHAMYAAKKEGS